jgi:hypothetical protein
MEPNRGSGTKRKLDEVTGEEDEAEGTNDDRVTTLEEYYYGEGSLQSLQQEAQHQMKNAKKWGKEGVCTYDRGYIKQRVHWCET